MTQRAPHLLDLPTNPPGTQFAPPWQTERNSTMPTNPPFQSVASSATNHVSPIIEVDKALESMRDAGFDLLAAAGEPIDNSIEANATLIRVEPKYSKDRKHITEIAFADNGRGIEPAMLAQVLRMGYSSRYGQRKGLGRFGVGLKLAALSLGKRIEVITRPLGSDVYHRVFLDLTMIQKGTQEVIQAVEVDGWPDEYVHLMTDAKGGQFESGTLVLWQHIDRLSSGGSYGTSLETKLSDLRKFIARAYRKFLDSGLQIELAGNSVTLHDPLFLLDNPRIERRYGDRKDLIPAQLRGRVIEETDLEVEGYNVHVTVTVAPEIFRYRKGTGGAYDLDGKEIREFQINDETEGRISMMRNGREIYYDIVPKMLSNGVQRGDRYIGVEVAFPAELDEFFQVRHVKRGAEPVSKLRDAIRAWLRRPIKQARDEVRRHWNEVSAAEQTDSPDGRNPAIQDAIDRSEQTAPRGQAGSDLTPEDENAKIDEILEDLDIDPQADPERADQLRQQILGHAISILDASWPGKELLTIDHLNAKAVVRLNHRHPFIRDIYAALRDSASRPFDDQEPSDMHELIRQTWMSLDMLFQGYAKAENLHHEPDEMFGNLRTYWGQHTQSYMRELARTEE